MSTYKEILSIIEHGSINYEYLLILGIYFLVTWKLNKFDKVITKLIDKIEENDDRHKKEIKYLEDKLQFKYDDITNCEIIRKRDFDNHTDKIESKIEDINKKQKEFEVVIKEVLSDKHHDDAFFIIESKLEDVNKKQKEFEVVIKEVLSDKHHDDAFFIIESKLEDVNKKQQEVEVVIKDILSDKHLDDAFFIIESKLEDVNKKHQEFVYEIINKNKVSDKHLDDAFFIINKIESKIEDVNKKQQEFEVVISNKVSHKQLDDAFFIMSDAHFPPPKNYYQNYEKVFNKLPKKRQEILIEQGMTKEKFEKIEDQYYYRKDLEIVNKLRDNTLALEIYEIVDSSYDQNKEPNGYIGCRDNFKECSELFGSGRDATISKIRNNECFYYLYVAQTGIRDLNQKPIQITISIIFDFETYIGLGTFDKKTRVITFDKKYRKYMLGGYDHCF